MDFDDAMDMEPMEVARRVDAEIERIRGLYIARARVHMRESLIQTNKMRQMKIKQRLEQNAKKLSLCSGRGKGRRQNQNAFGKKNSTLSKEDVLELIGAHLPIQDVYQCRLVCRMWATVFARFLAARKVLQVFSPECVEAERTLEMRKTKIFRLEGLTFQTVSLSSSLGRRLLVTFGLELQSVHLHDCGVTMAQLSVLLYEVAPNIQSLVIVETPFHFDETETPLPPSILKLLKASRTRRGKSFLAPSVKHLRLHLDRPYGAVQLREISNIFPSLVQLEFHRIYNPIGPFKSGPLLNLRFLTLKAADCISAKHLQILASLKMPLTKLSIWGFQCVDELAEKRLYSKNFMKLLQSVSSTLKFLQCYQTFTLISTNDQTFNFDWICLPKLTKLDMDLKIMDELSPIEKMPMLKSLQIKCLKDNLWTKSVDKIPKPHLNIKDLNIGAVNDNVMRSLAPVFPSLTKLTVDSRGFNDSTLTAIIVACPLIQSLSITAAAASQVLASVTDAAFTGIPAHDLEKLSNIDKKSKKQKSLAQKLRKGPYIANLKKLKSLSLCSIDSALTDASIYYGLSDVKTLKCLHFSNAKFSAAALKTLRATWYKSP